jgi:L-fuconolactonase
MVDFPIVDTHVHLWDPTRIRYPWLEDIPQLNKPFLLEDFSRHCGPVQVDKIVFLQCDCVPEASLQEAQWIASLAEMDPRIRGMVPWAPVESGEMVRSSLDALKAIPLVRGIRRLIQSEDVDFCIQPGFVKGVQILAEYDFSFDICIYHRHLANTIRLVEQCPDVRFILDHIGKPDIQNGTKEPWQKELKTLAGFQNVTCKVSGMVTEADHEKWTRDDLKPYIDHVAECCGPDRMVFGGDWPVATLACAYPDWVEALGWALSGWSGDELRRVFRENATDFYRLG